MLNKRKRLWYALSLQTGLCRGVVYQIIFPPTPDECMMVRIVECAEITITETTFEHHACMARESNSELNPWVIDSGCSAHFSPNQSEFTTYAPYTSPHQIHLGDSRVIPSMGEGTVSLECLVNGKSLTCLIHSVQYIPALTYTLLSCKALTHRGLTITFKGDCCKVYHVDGTLIAESSQVPNQLYFLSIAKVNSSMMTDNNAALTTAPSFDLMHKCLAHPGKDALQAMICRKLAVGLDDVPDDSKDFDCEACVHGKMTRAPFQKGHDTAREHLGCLHSDVCGPMETTSLGKRWYFCTLVDDKSGYTWLYLCALKSDFTEWFVKLDRLFVNQYGTHTKILCSDCSGEYVNTPLKKYCAENGIKLKFTVLHTPKQNGVAKRTNRKILDKGQAIMKDTRAPDFLWADAFMTVVGRITVPSINRLWSLVWRLSACLESGIIYNILFNMQNPSKILLKLKLGNSKVLQITS